jgi:hypothetical protein
VRKKCIGTHCGICIEALQTLIMALCDKTAHKKVLGSSKLCYRKLSFAEYDWRNDENDFSSKRKRDNNV